MIIDVQNRRPVIGVFSDPNFLSLNIIENLLSKKCYVKIFTDNVNLWRARTLHLANLENLAILPIEKSSRNFLDLSYSVFVSGFVSGKNLYNQISGFSKFKLSVSLKKILILPFEKFEGDKNFKIQTDDNLAIIYLGDLLGARIDVESDLLMSSLLRETRDTLTFRVGFGERFYPIFVADAAKLIVKWLFSFGPYGKETFVLGDETSADLFYKQLLRHSPNLKMLYDEERETRILPRGFEVKRLPCNLQFALSETVGWMYRTAQAYNPKRKITIKISKRIKYSFIGAFLALLLFMSPFILVGTSAILMGVAYKDFTVKGVADVQNTLLIAKSISTIGREESLVFEYIPFVGSIYRESYFGGSLISEASDMAGIVAPLISNSSELFTKVVGQDIYDPQPYIDKMLLSLDGVYQSISFLEAESRSEANNNVLLAKIFLDKVDLERIKTLTGQGKIILSNLPDDLGKSGRRRYLILFQNNMELRPTGGFIGSFGLITFEGGRMTDFSVSDVYSADGQLRGHVEPPAAIKNYLGEANWFLRDSNWDPDFSTSAKRAEWFLGKEMDQNVDGVIGIDLEVAKRILKVTGPMFLADYNLDITDKNLYEKTQAEAQTNFFPGSTQKASFLTALSRNLLAELGKVSGANRLSILRSFFNDLDERHIQIFLHNEATQNAISNLGWSGEVLTPICNKNCYADLVGVVEANVGVNKANYFINRQEKFELEISGGKIKRTLTLTLTNSANPILSDAGRYKAYIRLLTPPDAENYSVSIVTGENINNVTPETYTIKDHEEIGTLVELLPRQTKKVVFSWQSSSSLDLSQTGDYRLYVRKQAGILEAPLGININLPGVKVNLPTGFTLTASGAYVYNTTLARDMFTHISW